MYLMNSLKDVLLQYITQSMVMTTQWDITLPMAYIQSNHHSWKQSQLHKDQKKKIAIIRGPTRFFYPETLQEIMKECIILYNMIVEDE